MQMSGGGECMGSHLLQQCGLGALNGVRYLTAQMLLWTATAVRQGLTSAQVVVAKGEEEDAAAV